MTARRGYFAKAGVAVDIKVMRDSKELILKVTPK